MARIPWRRLWRLRPLALYLFVFSFVAACLYGFAADRIVSRADAALERDPATGIIRGMEPRTLGPPDSPRALLMVHGFIGCPQNYAGLPDRIAARGWRVEAMLVAGHGTSPRAFERTTPDAMIESVRTAFRALRAEHETAVIMGHSLGGALATLVAAEEQPDGLILGAPYFGLTTATVLGVSAERWTQLVGPALRWLPSREGGAPVNLVENRRKVLSYPWVPIAAAQAAFEVRARALQPAVSGRIAMPTLLVHSRNDRVTSFHAAEDAVRRFPAADKTVVPLDKSDHVIFWDYDAEATAEAVLAFLDRWPAPAAATAGG